MRNPWNYKNNGDECDETRIISIEKSSNDAAAIGNKLYFYSDVTKDSMLSLIKQIDEMSKQLKVVQYTFNLATPPPIELHICSDGGDVFSAIAAVDRIMGNDIPIHTYCEGIVASAATLVSCSGHKRFITQSSCMLIHQVTSGLWGNYAEFKEEIKNLDLVMSLIKGIYIKKTKLDSTKLDEILSHDLYMTGAECLTAGLVDEVI